MPHHISNLGDSLVIHWREDQPTIRTVKEQIVDSGLVRELVGRSESGIEEEVEERGLYLNRSGEGHTYVCFLRRLPPTKNASTEAILPKYEISIKREGSASDAIGDVYTDGIPDWLQE